MVQLSHPNVTTGKTIALTILSFVGNVDEDTSLDTSTTFVVTAFQFAV